MASPELRSVISQSLVIPTYNRADLIGETIACALAQTMKFAEIIVVDDGSTDHTQAILAGFGQQIRVILTQNSGVQAARNTGVDAASSDYVTLCDSDDLLQPDYVETVSPWLATHADIDMLFANFRTFDYPVTNSVSHPDKFSQAPEGWFQGAKEENNFFWDIPEFYVRTVRFQPLFPTGMTFKKEFYKTIGGYDVAFNRVAGEDWEFTLRAIAAGKVALCTLPLAQVRKHAGNDSGDLVKLLLGEVHILKHAVAHHAAAGLYKDAMQASIAMRRLNAFNAAYANGNFEAVKSILSSMDHPPTDKKFQLKKLITSLPATMRKPLWRLSQR